MLCLLFISLLQGSCDALKRLKAVTPRTEKENRFKFYKTNIENRVPGPTGKYVIDPRPGHPQPVHPELFRSITSYFHDMRTSLENERKADILAKLKENGKDGSIKTEMIGASVHFADDLRPCLLPPIPARKSEGPGLSSSKFDQYSGLNGTQFFEVPTVESLNGSIKTKYVKVTDRSAGKHDNKENVYVTVGTLRPRDIFGIDTVRFPGEDYDNDPVQDVALVSKGAEIVMLSKKIFIKNANERTKLRVVELTSSYPREETLTENLQTRADWHTYRQSLVSDVMLSNKQKQYNEEIRDNCARAM